MSRTWAPRGQTPVIEEKAGKEHLSLIAAMAPNGQLYVGGQDKAYDSEGVIGFLEYLSRRYRRKNLMVVWDGATIHRSKAVKEFLSRRKGRIHLVSLPGYSPELNGSGRPSCRTSVEPVKKGAEESGVPQSCRLGGSIGGKN